MKKELVHFYLIGGAIVLTIFLWGIVSNSSLPVGQVYEYADGICIESTEWVPLEFDVSSFAGQDIELVIEEGVCGDICGELKVDDICIGDHCLGAIIDSDGDSILDSDDQCPQSLPNAVVDATGCAPHIVHYPFNNDGSELIHSVDGVVHNAYFSPGVRKGAVYFDGIDDFVAISDHELLHLQDTFTIAFWLWVDPSINEKNVLFMKNTAGSGDSGFISTLQPDGLIQLCTPNDCIGDIIPMDEQWHHITFTYHQGHSELYVDSFSSGVKDNLYFNGDDSDTFYLNGRRGEAEFFTGAIDEFKIFSTALGASDIEQLCQMDGGCSAPDSDGDGFAGGLDYCPLTYGTQLGCEPYQEDIGDEEDLYIPSVIPELKKVEYDLNHLYVTVTNNDVVNTVDYWSVTPFAIGYEQGERVSIKGNPMVIKSLQPNEEHTYTYMMPSEVEYLSYMTAVIHVGEISTRQYLGEVEDFVI